MFTKFVRPNQAWLFDGDDGGGGGGEPAGETGGGGEPSKTFTQADVSAAAGTARSEGRAAAEKKLADDLGVPLAEAKELIARAREQDESQKTEAQKAREKAEADSRAADERTAAADLRVHQSDVKDALRDAGVEKEKLGKVSKLVEVEVGADEAAIKTAVEATKKEFPELFGGASGAPDSDTGGSPKPKTGEDAMAKGYKRATESNSDGSYPILSGKS